VTSKTSQVLVLDAGHISIGSDLADKNRVKEVQAKRGRQYSADDYKELEDLMYDRMQISLDSTQLLISDDAEAAMNALEGHVHGAESDLHVVERINMSFTVQNAIVNAPTLTKFKIAGHLPELQLNFSDRKYQSLMKFIDIAIPNFGGDEEEPEPVVVATPTKFGRRPVEEYTLDETDKGEDADPADTADDASVDDKGNDQFYEANDDQTDVSYSSISSLTLQVQRAELQQISFEFSFRVGKLQASLFRSTSATTERALAYASLENFGLTLIQRKYEMSIDLFLRNITLAMIEQGSRSEQPLLSSAAVAGDDDDDGHKLVQVRYLRVQQESPTFYSVHEGFDTSIETDLSTFNITLAPEPILSLYDFIMTTFRSGGEEPDEPDAKSVQSEHSEHGDATDTKMRIKIRLTSAQVSLANNNLQLALLSLPSADVVIVMRASTMRVSARLGDISIEDTTDSSVASPSFKKLLAIEGDELADFSYETYDPSEASFPGYNSSIHLRTGSLKFTFMEKPIHELYSWGRKFARLKGVYDAASQAAVERVSEVTRMQYDVEIKTPIIVLPRDGLSSPDVLILRLGEIVAKNKYLQDPNDTSTIDASLRGVNVASELHLDGRKAVLQLIDDVTLTSTIKQAGGTEHRSDPHHADTEITTTMSDVKMSLTQRQYVLLMEVLEAIPRALSGLSDDEDVPETPASITEPPTPLSDGALTPMLETDLAPELVLASSVWTTFDFEFVVKSIGLEVYNANAFSEDDLKKHSIARFSLLGSHLGLKTLSNNAMELEFTLKTLAFSSTRATRSWCSTRGRSTRARSRSSRSTARVSCLPLSRSLLSSSLPLRRSRARTRQWLWKRTTAWTSSMCSVRPARSPTVLTLSTRP
jgi:vacuolar protein sorting-associated protein 13A/C